MPTLKNQTIVITGCGSGIGNALALELHQRGHQIYATDLNLDSMEHLAQLGIATVELNVNRADHIAALVKRLNDDGATVDFLINNAGFGAIGPIYEMPMETLRAQFETNVFSIVALSQALLPTMLNAGQGCIVNVGSVSGVMTTPFAGAYCASKAAVHAISDAMRMELEPFGIRVVTIQPGGIRSEFGVSAAKGVAERMQAASIYAEVADGIVNRAQESQQSATTAEDFAKTMADKILTSSPSPRVRIGKKSTSVPMLRRFVPTTILDSILRKRFQLDKLTK